MNERTVMIPDIAVLTAIFGGIGAMIVAVVAWLDKRSKNQRDEVLAEHAKDLERMKGELNKLSERVTALENGQREARKILIDALLTENVEEIHQQIRRAIETLH